MPVSVVTAAAPIVSWAEAKAHLRQDGDDEKSYVEGLIAAATAWIDGPGGWVGQAFGPQLLEWRLDDWPDLNYRLPIGPELEIDSVAYMDLAGTEQTWPFPTPLYFENLPALRGRSGDLRIRYWAGYGKRDPEDASKWIAEPPAPVKQAVLLLVGQWFRTRENVIPGSVSAVPFAAEALLAPFRSWQ